MHIVESGDFEVCSGVLGQVDGGIEGVVRFKQHIFVESTRDGGMSAWIEGPRWMGWAEKSEVFSVAKADEELSLEPRGGAETKGKRRLQGYCHCRGVEFYITPPDDETDSSSATENNVSSTPPPPLYPIFYSLLSFRFLVLIYTHTHIHSGVEIIAIAIAIPTPDRRQMVAPCLGHEIPRRSLRLQFLPSSHGLRSPSLGIRAQTPYPTARWERGRFHNGHFKDVLAFRRRLPGFLREMRRHGVLAASGEEGRDY